MRSCRGTPIITIALTMYMEAGGFVVQKHWRATQERVEKFLSDTYFTDANLRGRYVFSR